MFIAIGYHDLNQIRQKKYNEAKEKGYKLISYISSKINNFGGFEIGDNCFILDNQIIQPFVKIGNNVTIWSGVMISHNCTIEDHCWIASGVIIAGTSTIKQNCFIGINCSIGHEIIIGKENFIGAGCIITKNTEDKSVFLAPDTEKYRIDSNRFIKFTKFK